MNIEAFRRFSIPSAQERFTARDAMLYALGLGYGSDPERSEELDYVYEGRLKVHPAVALVLGRFEQWTNTPELEIDWRRILHAEQSLRVFRPIKADIDIRAEYSFTGLQDRGPDRGAMLHITKNIFAQGEPDPVATAVMSWLLAGDGGFGGDETVPSLAGPALPSTAPDDQLELAVPNQAALLYRLNGDYNPLHADPAAARTVGFDRPILHGLATYGYAWRALARMTADGDANRIEFFTARFSKPFYPGETLRTEIWRQGRDVRFRCKSVERDIIVLDRGTARLAAGPSPDM
ncbi:MULTISPECIES: MaoC/PaaZ C-terminal domain-containing protein [Sphingobium]|uniref:MaoC/PaaZ C-terminal domain-containing protein n=1 Tax=Sphingobium TaxID=165695 RepID=UPI00159C66D4|nr:MULTISPECIES: MaoC/PaaZ C-terminal domain-containing protein [unclassified Sphingobium]